MAAKTLPIHLQPPITGYLHHAYSLSILANHQAYLPWFCSQYIQLIAPRQGVEGGLNFYIHPVHPLVLSPLLDIQWMNREIAARTRGGIVAFVKDALAAAYYVEVFADEFYIPHRKSYQRAHFVHDVLVFGFDDKMGSFDIIGFDERGNYTTSKIGFSAFEKAFNGVDLSAVDSHVSNWPTKVWLAKYLAGAGGDFDPICVLEQLRDYLSGSNPAARLRLLHNPAGGDANVGIRRRVENIYGVQVYKKLDFHLGVLLHNPRFCNPTTWRILWEHKKCMGMRIRFMEDSGYLDSSCGLRGEYRKIEESAAVLHRMMFKFACRPAASLGLRAALRLREIAGRESAALERLVAGLGRG